MKTSIEVVTECLKWEADEYKRKYDEIKSARNTGRQKEHCRISEIQRIRR